MKLVVPTDFEILEAMSDFRRQTAPNLAEILNRRRQYMNDRLSSLATMGLVNRVGPSERSGMYEITAKGLRALEHQNEYDHANANDFSDLLEAENKVDTTPGYQRVLLVLSNQEPTDVDELSDLAGLKKENVEDILESLEARGLILRANNGMFEVTSIGEKALQSLLRSSSEIQGFS